MLVIWSTFCPKAGELTSCATRSSMQQSTRSPSFDFWSVESGTRPADFSGETEGTGSGGVSLRSSVALAVAVLLFIRIPSSPQVKAWTICPQYNATQCSAGTTTFYSLTAGEKEAER